MTREALKEAAMLTMRAAKRRMEKKGLIDMYFVYVRPDGSVEREDVDGSVVNSPEAKSIQFKDAGQRARQIGAEAVIYVSDAWFLDPRGQEYEANIAALGIEVAREIADEVGVVEAARLGLGKALEVIQVVLQTPNWNYSLIQEYERLGTSKMFIRFVGQPHEFDDSDGTARASGRGMAFFRGGAA